MLTNYDVELISINQAKKMLKRGREKFMELYVETNILPLYREPDGRLLVKKLDVLNYIESCRVRTKQTKTTKN